MKASDFAELLGIDHLDSSLDEVATALVGSLSGTGELVEPARRMLEAGGKRLRPLLTIASAVASEPSVGLTPLDARVRRGAASVELVHVGSLVHDDIMDEALSRRGVPTVNAVEGSNQALLVGEEFLAPGWIAFLLHGEQPVFRRRGHLCSRCGRLPSCDGTARQGGGNGERQRGQATPARTE